MPTFLDTRGHPDLSIAICARCSVKYPRTMLSSDPNAPGLMVCPDGCKDQFDPYRLAPRPPDQITLPWARPDVTLAPGPMDVWARQMQAALGTERGLILEADAPGAGLAIAPPVTVVQQPTTWTASTPYILGSQVTPTDPVGFTSSGNLYNVFTCIAPGRSGASAPTWSDFEGVEVTDGGVLWINAGLYMP